MSDSETVRLPRLAVASALDFLTDYHAELERAEADGPYTAELKTEIDRLETHLEESQNHNEHR